MESTAYLVHEIGGVERSCSAAVASGQAGAPIFCLGAVSVASYLARQSSWQSVLPHFGMLLSAAPLPHRECYRRPGGSGSRIWGGFGDKPTLPDFLFFQCTKSRLLLRVLWDSWARGARVWAGGGQRPALSTGCPHGPEGAHPRLGDLRLVRHVPILSVHFSRDRRGLGAPVGEHPGHAG